MQTTRDEPTTPPFPSMVEWEITRACDLHCQHCYNRPGRKRESELSKEGALAVARRLGRLGCRSLTLSGGEPTLRSDWPRIAETLADQSIGVQMVSHGQGVDRAVAETMRNAGVRMAMLSLDGVDGTHDRIRRRPGAYRGVMTAAGALRNAGVAFGFTTVALRQNRHEIQHLAEIVQSVGAAMWTVWLGIPTGRGSLWLEPREIPALVSELGRLRKSCRVLRLGDNLALPIPHRSTCRTGCVAGHEGMGLRSDGTVVGCLALARERSNDSLCTGSWEGMPEELRSSWEWRQHQLESVCRGCERWGVCHNGCHATFAAIAPDGRCWHKDNMRVGATPKRAASVAASLLLASATVGCNGQRPEPTEPEKPSPATTTVHVEESPPSPAQSSTPENANASNQDTKDYFAGTTPASAEPPPQDPPANRPSSMPSCCMMHVLRPGCQCGRPIPPKPKKTP